MPTYSWCVKSCIKKSCHVKFYVPLTLYMSLIQPRARTKHIVTLKKLRYLSYYCSKVPMKHDISYYDLLMLCVIFCMSKCCKFAFTIVARIQPYVIPCDKQNLPSHWIMEQAWSSFANIPWKNMQAQLSIIPLLSNMIYANIFGFSFILQL